jgi:hypothetical protein
MLAISERRAKLAADYRLRFGIERIQLLRVCDAA